MFTNWKIRCKSKSRLEDKTNKIKRIQAEPNRTGSGLEFCIAFYIPIYLHYILTLSLEVN